MDIKTIISRLEGSLKLKKQQLELENLTRSECKKEVDRLRGFCLTRCLRAKEGHERSKKKALILRAQVALLCEFIAKLKMVN